MVKRYEAWLAAAGEVVSQVDVASLLGGWGQEMQYRLQAPPSTPARRQGTRRQDVTRPFPLLSLTLLAGLALVLGILAAPLLQGGSSSSVTSKRLSADDFFILRSDCAIPCILCEVCRVGGASAGRGC